MTAPFRCAEMDGAPSEGGAPGSLAMPSGRRLELDGDRLILGPSSGSGRDHTLVAGVVSDARGASAPTLTQVGRLRAELEREGVELVISLGGMGTSEAEIQQVLAALAKDAPWVVWAIPGDRESIPAHRRAVAALGAAGAAVFDGARVRLIEADGTVLASFPGGGEPSQLAAGTEGCIHGAEDASAMALRLAAQKGVRVWAGHVPPRQAGATGSDLSLGGIHIGEPAVAAALPASRARLVLHGLVDEAVLGAPAGKAPLGERGPPTVLGSGPIEAMPVAGVGGAAAGGGALVVRVDATADEITWRRVRFPLGGGPGPR